MAGMEAIKQALQTVELAFNVSKQCILFYSGGKDSACVLHLLEKYYSKKDIRLVFMPFVEGLKETELVHEMARKQGYGVHLYQHWRYFVDKAQFLLYPAGQTQEIKRHIQGSPRRSGGFAGILRGQTLGRNVAAAGNLKCEVDG